MRPQLGRFVERHGYHVVLHVWRCVGLFVFAIVSAGIISIGVTAAATQTDTIVQFNLNYSVAGTDGPISSFEIELYDSEAPITVANFLKYVNNGLYDNTIIHRDSTDFVMQGGGYTPEVSNGTVTALNAITSYGAIQNEFSSTRSNVAGTIAMAKVSGDANSATNEWFVNLADNSSNLDSQNGGFTVFGKVLGEGMTLINAVNSLTTYDLSTTLGSAFTAVPKINSGNSSASYVTITSATVVSTPTPLTTSTGKLSGFLYVDMNHDGVMDGNDYAIAGAKVSLTQAGSSTPLATVVSGSDGSYHFNNLNAGTFTVTMVTPTNLSGQDNGSQQVVLDKDGNIISTGTAGTAVQDGVSSISLDDAQTVLNLNIAEPAYPVALISARLLLGSAAKIPHTSSVAVLGTNAASDSSLSFGNVLVGKSGSTTLTVTNLGSQGGTLSGSFPGASGTFGSAGTATFGPLDSSEEASQDYTYTPTARGANTQDITITSTVGNMKVTLSGTGVAPVSSLTQSNAGYVLVGGTVTGTASITITNAGDGNLSGLGTISNLNGTIPAGSGKFSGAGGSLSLADSGSQTLSYTYTPTVRGADSAVISTTFTNGNPDGTNAAYTQDVTLTGTAVAPVSSLTQSNAGYVLVGGTVTGTASITITNAGDGNLSGLGTISNLNGTIPAGSGKFSGAGGSVTLADSGLKTFSYTYTPTVRGADSAVISTSFTNGNPDGTNAKYTQDITLTGTAVAPVSSLTQSDAGYVLVGGTVTGTASITITNAGDGNLSGLGTISNLNGTIPAGSGKFSGAGGSLSLADSGSQTLSYTYTPTVRGADSAVISTTFTNGNPDGTNAAYTKGITLIGTAVAPVSSLAQSDTGYVLVGSAGTASITIKNTGDGNLSGAGASSNLIGSIAGGSGNFSGAGGSVSLGDGASQTFSYTYDAPKVRGATNSTIISASFTNGNPDGTNTANTKDITLTGTAVAPVSSLAQSDTGYALVGSTGTASITIKNTGDGNLSGAGASSNLIGSIAGGSGNFSGAGGSVTLGDGASQTFSYTYTPTVRGATDSAVISASFTNGNPDGTNTANMKDITLASTAVAPVSSLTQSDAGYALVGSTGTASITIKNTGDGNLSGVGASSNLNGAIPGGSGNFSGSGGSISLNDGASQTFGYTYTPTVRGADSVVISASFINGNPDGTNTANAKDISLTGTGVAPVQSVDTTAVNVGLVRIGSLGAASVTVQNIGNGNLSGRGGVSNLNGTVASASGNFSGSGGSISLLDGAARTFNFTYAPTAHTADSTTIAMAFSNGSADGKNLAETVNAQLSGQGVGPTFSSDQTPGSTLDFGTLRETDLASLPLHISNASTDSNGGDTTLTDLTLLSAQITGTDGDLFSVVGFTPGAVLHEGDSLDLEIAYNGTGTTGDKSAVLTILTDEGAALGADGNAFVYQITATFPLALPSLGNALTTQVSVSSVPEPGSLALLAIAGLFLGGLTWRRRALRSG